jgi:dihydrofolate reductase/thymidylate synthase
MTSMVWEQQLDIVEQPLANLLQCVFEQVSEDIMDAVTIAPAEDGRVYVDWDESTVFCFTNETEFEVIHKNPKRISTVVHTLPTDPKDAIAYTLEQVKRYEQYWNNKPEQFYLNHIQNIIRRGSTKMDRTGKGTKSLFGLQMTYSLRNDSFPLFTTKKMFWRGIVEELLWFIKGNTDAKVLAERGVHIWDGHGTREYLDHHGFSNREEGDLGPIYGFQWRHYGAKYVDCHTDYKGQGIDQLAGCIETLKTNPNDRRIVMTAWAPTDLSEMILPPCHMFCQFYVNDKNELSCQMYQRSADMGLGVPFNVASYALLTRMIAQVCGLGLGEFIHTLGDAHVYLDHIEGLKKQTERIPKSFPTLKINPAKMDIDSFEFTDFELIGYTPDEPIKLDLAL